MTRQPVRDVSGPAAITPRAAPVSTYVRPAEPAPSNLHQLAQGLAAFDEGLSGFLAKRTKEKDDADKIRGTAAFNKNNQTGYAEAVRQGIISPAASPVFVENYKKAQGNLAGIQLREKFNSEYLSWEGRNSNDPVAFQGFLGEFIKRNVQTDDVDVLRGMTPHLETLTTDAYEVFGKERASTTYNGSINTNAAVSGETIDYANREGLASENGTDYGALTEDLLEKRRELLETGVRHEDYDKQFVKTITTKAIEHGDPELLDLLDVELPEYGGVALSSLPEFSEIKQNALETLEDEAVKREVARDKRQAKLDQAAEDKTVRGVMDILAEDPMSEIPEDVLREWSRYDPMARTKLETARKTLLDADTTEDPGDLLTVERMIQDGATTSDLFDLVRDGTIRDPQTLKNALDRAEKRREARLKGDGILTTQTSKRMLSTIKQRTDPDPLSGSMFAPDGLTDEGLEATKDFELMLIEFETNNPDASLMEREKFINEAGAVILQRITEEDRQYVSPQEAEAMRKEAEAAATPPQEEEPDAPAPGGEEEEASASKSYWSLPSADVFKKGLRKALEIDAGIGRPTKSDTEAYQQWVENKTKEHYGGAEAPEFKDMDRPWRLKLEEDADKLGMTPEELNVKIWKKLNEAVNGATEGEPDPRAETVEGNLEKSSLAVPDDASETIGSTIDQAVLEGARISTKTASVEPEAQKVSPLLDLIGQTEGTDRGRGYNETLGYGAYTGGDVELTSMTLGDIDKLQTKMLRHPKNKLNSSALGRYQIVRTTLRKLKTQMGLKDDDVFTPELQDKMALALLGGRGLDRWVDGKMSDKAMMNALAKEWASLPTSNGKGYYTGQRAGTTPDGVLSAFQMIRDPGGAEGQAAINKAMGGGEKNIFKQYENAKLDQVVTANDRGYAPDIDNVSDDVKTRLVSLQKAFGKALPVVSGFRDAKRNAKAGGAKKSQHTHGNAVDISVKDMPLEERVRLIRMASEAGFTGIGVYDNSLHFDVGGRRYWGPSFRSASLPKWAKEAITEHMERSA